MNARILEMAIRSIPLGSLERSLRRDYLGIDAVMLAAIRRRYRNLMENLNG